MAASTRRISIVVDGNSTSAQSALAKAGEAMTRLGEMVVKQSNLAVQYDEKVIKSNDAVMASYERMLSTISRSSVGVDEAIKTQTASQEKLAESAGASSDTIVASAERQATAVRAAATSFDQAVDSQIDGLGRVAGSADSVAADVIAASERQVEAIRTSTASIDEALDAQVAGLGRVVEAADIAADGVVKAAEKQSAAMKTSADQQVAAQKRASNAAVSNATKQNAAFDLTGTGLAKLGKNTTLAAAGIGAASIYMAAKFEQSTTRLLTQAGATTGQIGKMRSELLDMAGQVGQTPEHLSESFYHVVSAMNAVLPPAHRTTEELQIQKVAAEGAAVGHTQLEETTYALSSAMNALHVNAGQAEKTMGTLNAIVGAGDMTMGDLLAAMKSGLIPTARSFGIDLESVGSALAVMGDQGMRGAMAGTRLRMSIALLAAPSAKAAEMLKAIGLSNGEVTSRTKAMSEALEAAGLTTTHMAEDVRKPNGLTFAFRDLDEHLKKSGLSATESAALLSRAFGGGRMGATIMLLSQSTDRLDAKYKQIHQTTNTFGHDWETTQKTLSQEAKEFEGSVESLGVKFGTVLIPKGEEFVGTLKEIFHWFEENKSAARALEYTVGGVLATAVGVYAVGSFIKLINSVRSAYTEFGKLESYLRGWSTNTAAGAAAGEAGATTSTKLPGAVTGSATGVYGAFGATMPGSRANPIVVAVEAGQYAALGGRAAASEVTAASAAENEGAKAEAVSKGGVILPPGATADEEAKAASTPVEAPIGGELPVAEEALVGGGLLSSVKGIVGPLLANAMKGGLIAGAGLIGSQVVGSAVGGKAGKDVSSIGSGAAIGAGIGTVVLGPGVGTAIGAAMGAAPGVIKAMEGASHAEHEGRAGNFKGGPKGAVFEEAEKEQQRIGAWEEKEHKLVNRNADIEHKEIANKWNREIREQGQHQIGEVKGKAEAAFVLKGAKNPELGSIVRTSKQQLEGLSPIAREGYAKMMKTMVQTLEQEERLPKGALQKVLDALKPELSNLPHMAATTGHEFASQLASSINLTEVENKLNTSTKQISENWGNRWHEFEIQPHESFQGMSVKIAADLTHLESVFNGKNVPKKEREEAASEYRQLRGEWEKYVDQAGVGVAKQLTKANAEWKHLTSSGVHALIEEWGKLPAPIQAKMEQAGGAVSAGVKKINEALLKELTELNGGKTPSSLSHGGPPLAPGLEKVVEAKGHATGGLIQVGKQGEKGRDSVPFMAGGVPIITAPGEQIAVFTHQQQAVANAKMADIGGLPGLFRGVSQPHHMATGGFVPFAGGGEVTTGAHYSKTQLEQIWKRDNPGNGNPSLMGAIALAESAGDPGNIGPPTSGGRAEGLWQIMMPVNATYVHGNVFNPDVNAKAAGSILHSQGLGAWETYTNGMYRKYLGASGAGGGASSSTAATPATIQTPQVGLGGAIGQIAQAAVNNSAAAANKLLQREAANTNTAGITGAGGGAAGSTPSGVAGLGKFDGLPVASWIIPELLYAQRHGWHGDITSGWRSPTEVIHSSVVAPQGQSEHQGTQWPHGAVDFGSPSEGTNRKAFERASVGYTGHRLIKATGFVDEGHMSGTGHERGGYVNAFEEGGLVPIPFMTGGAKTTKELHEKEAAEKRHKKKLTKKPIPSKNADKPGHPKLTKHSVASALAPLNLIPDTEKLPNEYELFAKGVDAVEAQAQLMQAIESTSKSDTFMLPGDFQYINPMLKYINITPGMQTGQALTATENALTKNKQAVAGPGKGKATIPQEEEAEALEYVQQFVTWAAGQPSHRMLTGSDAGLLAGTKAGVGWAPKAGENLWRAELTNAELKVNQLGGEEKMSERDIRLVAGAIAERHRREQMVMEVMQKEKYRLDLTKGHVTGLTTGTLKKRISEAESSENYRLRQEAVKESVSQIQESINQEKAVSKPNKQMIKELESHKSAVSKALGHGKPAAGKVEAAKIKLLENELKSEETPIEEALSKLGGSRTAVGTKGGEYAKLEKDIKTLNGGITTYTDAITKIRSSDMPTAKLAEQQIEEAAKDAPIPPFIPQSHEAAESESTSELAELEKQQIEVLSKSYAISQAQYAVLANFGNVAAVDHVKMNQGGVVVDVKSLPHFEKGGPVLEDGPIYAHRGEHVVPRDGALVAGGSGAPTPVHVQTTHVFQGELAPLMRLIDERIAHPENVRVVSRQQQQRTQGFPGYAGRRR